MKEVTYSVGQYFHSRKFNDVYVLMQPTYNTISLCSIVTGKRWHAMQDIQNHKSITEKEFEWLVGSEFYYLFEVTKQQAAELLLTSNKTD